MKGLVLATALLLSSSVTSGQTATSTPDWMGVWHITTPGKPGGVINIARDAGPNGSSLSGTIVFYVMNRETGERIAIEPRTMVNPHLEGDTLVFQVRRILKPHLQGDPPASEAQPDPSDIVEMTLTAAAEGKATLNCPKCGAAAPTELVKEK